MALSTCPDCGYQVSSEAASCPNCGKPLNKPDATHDSYNEPPPKTWLVESILATLFCCLPFGVIGIIYAAKVETDWYAGRKEMALNDSRMAKTWTMAAFFSAIAGVVLYILYIVFAALIGFGIFTLGH